LIRIWGYERLPSTLPTGAVKAPQPNPQVEYRTNVRHTLAAAGLHETIHQPFCSVQALQRLHVAADDAVALPNPLSAETAFLSPTHVQGMLTDLGTVNAEHEELGLFEIGHIFTPPHHEHEHLTILIRTSQTAEHAVRIIKSLLSRVAQVVNVPEPTFKKGEGLPYAESSHTLDIFVADQLIGKLTLVSAEVVAAHKIRRGREIVVAELDFQKLTKQLSDNKFYQPLPTYPISVRDLTIQLPAQLPHATLEAAASKAVDQKLVRSWHITDIFLGKPLPPDTKAVTLRLTYNAADRTLTDAEIKAHHDALEQALRNLTV
jgi:phenylalanyl-tRNA synthetase beta chain